MTRVLLLSFLAIAPSLAGCVRVNQATADQYGLVAETVLISHGYCKSHEDCAKRNIVRAGTFETTSILGLTPGSGVFVNIYGVPSDGLGAEVSHKIAPLLSAQNSPCVSIGVHPEPYSFQGNVGKESYVCPN